MPPALLRAVPADALAAVLVDADTSALPASHSAIALAPWAALALSGSGAPAAVAEVASALDRLRSNPWGLALIDVRAAALGEGSHRLADLQAALIVHTGGDNAAITQDVQGVLQRWTSRDTARIDSAESGGTRTFTLHDARLPEWAQMRWGAVGPYYVLALGERAFAAAEAAITGKAGTLADSADAAQLFAPAETDRAAVVVWLRCAGLRAALADVMKGRPDAVLAALGLSQVESGCWSVRRDDRAIVATMTRLRGGSVMVTPLCRRIDDYPAVRAALPGAALRYACIPHRAADLIHCARDAWLAARRPKVRETVRQAFADFESKAGLHIREELLDQLGDVILVHDYPPHPARVPLACTIMVRIAGSADRVQNALDRLLAQCSRWLNPAGSTEANPASFWQPQLQRLEDGIWTLRAGLYGPAIGVQRNWLVIGYAPAAVRANLEHLKTTDAVPGGDTPGASASEVGAP